MTIKPKSTRLHEVLQWIRQCLRISGKFAPLWSAVLLASWLFSPSPVGANPTISICNSPDGSCDGASPGFSSPPAGGPTSGSAGTPGTAGTALSDSAMQNESPTAHWKIQQPDGGSVHVLITDPTGPGGTATKSSIIGLVNTGGSANGYQCEFDSSHNYSPGNIVNVTSTGGSRNKKIVLKSSTYTCHDSWGWPSPPGSFAPIGPRVYIDSSTPINATKIIVYDANNNCYHYVLENAPSGSYCTENGLPPPAADPKYTDPSRPDFDRQKWDQAVNSILGPTPTVTINPVIVPPGSPGPTTPPRGPSSAGGGTGPNWDSKVRSVAPTNNADGTTTVRDSDGKVKKVPSSVGDALRNGGTPQEGGLGAGGTGTGTGDGTGGGGNDPNSALVAGLLSRIASNLDTAPPELPSMEGHDYKVAPNDLMQLLPDNGQKKPLSHWSDTWLQLMPFKEVIQGVNVTAGGSYSLVLPIYVGTIGTTYTADLSPVSSGLSVCGNIMYCFACLYAMRAAFTKR